MQAPMQATVLRLLEALADPLEAAVLGPALVRELYFRVLTGGQGGAMREALAMRGRFGSIGTRQEEASRCCSSTTATRAHLPRVAHRRPDDAGRHRHCPAGSAGSGRLQDRTAPQGRLSAFVCLGPFIFILVL